MNKNSTMDGLMLAKRTAWMNVQREEDKDIDKFFNEIGNTGEKENEEKITITLPNEYCGQKNEIISLVESMLTVYKGVKVK